MAYGGGDAAVCNATRDAFQSYLHGQVSVESWKKGRNASEIALEEDFEIRFSQWSSSFPHQGPRVPSDRKPCGELIRKDTESAKDIHYLGCSKGEVPLA